MRASVKLLLPALTALLTLTNVLAQECTETSRRQIEAMLDNGDNRALTREVMAAYGEEGKRVLVEVASDGSQPPGRRGRAIGLLGEYQSAAGKELLLGLMKDYPTLCAALGPLGAYRDPSLVPALIALLDESRRCASISQGSTGPTRTEHIIAPFVSDEAIGALEETLGKGLGEDNSAFTLLRPTQLWKDWWNANRTVFLVDPSGFIAPERNDKLQDEGYGCSVGTIAVSPDGRKAFSSGQSYDPWVRMWDIEKRQQIRATPTARHLDVTSATFSPDGQTIAMGTRSGGVEIFDSSTGRRLHLLIVGSDVYSVAFSPDGKMLGSASADGRICLFDTKSRCPRKTIYNSRITVGIAFSPDGALLAAATFEKVRLWSVADGKELREFEVLPGKAPRFFADWMEREAQLWRMAWRVAFSPDGNLLATGGSAAVQLWDPTTGQAIASRPSRGRVRSLNFSPDGRWVVWGTDGDEIIEWNLPTGRVLRFENEFSLGDTAMTPNGKLILSPRKETEVAMYDFQSGQEVGVLSCTK